MTFNHETISAVRDLLVPNMPPMPVRSNLAASAGYQLVNSLCNHRLRYLRTSVAFGEVLLDNGWEYADAYGGFQL